MSAHLSGAMIPLSGRIEDELYQWFISLEYPGAKSNSDKLREALKELRLQHEATADFIKAQTWLQNKTEALRQSLAIIDRDARAHSEIFSIMNEHIATMAATLLSARPHSTTEAAQIEEQLVRRAMALTEALLRQALTSEAAAFDPDVIRRHVGRSVELATLINSSKTGENNG